MYSTSMIAETIEHFDTISMLRWMHETIAKRTNNNRMYRYKQRQQ